LFVNYKNSESPLDGASWAEIMGDYLVTGEVLPFLEVGSGAPPKFPENIF
jgi:hypothetical protein